MKGIKCIISILKPYACIQSSFLRRTSSFTPCISHRNLSSSSSSALNASDVELSYSFYPNNNEKPDETKAPLIFLHGLFGAKGNLHSVSKHLSSSGRRVVTYDARNHGSSGHADDMDFLCMAQDLQDLIVELALKEPAVLGHSMGGKTAMTYALQHPDCLSSLIVADVAPHKSPNLDVLLKYTRAMKTIDIPQKVGLIKSRRKVEVQLLPAVQERDTLSFLLTNLVESKDGYIKWRINLDSVLDHFDAITDFPDLNCQPFNKPTLFVYGANSQHYKQADQGRIRALFPSSHIEAIPDTGHFLHAQKPIEFVNIVQNFLSSFSDGK